jgi:AcrR family transcriptional regulator
VARIRFIRDGYAATTVRDIADDAGVNVALINRYFTSKEGLFEACLGSAVSDLSKGTDNLTLDEIATRMVRRITGPTDDNKIQESLLMLLRTSGDTRIDEMRRAVLEGVSRKLAAAGGAEADDPVLLRAQVVLATAIGISVLRSSFKLMPLAAADEHELLGPVTDVINAMLPRPPA